MNASVATAGKRFNLRVGIADRPQTRRAVVIGLDILRRGTPIDPSLKRTTRRVNLDGRRLVHRTELRPARIRS